MALGEPALAQTTTNNTIVPYYGNINAFYGNINAFYGNVSAFYGNIAPFYGNISPFYGNISAFWTNGDPFIESTSGTQATFYGTSYDAFWGQGAGNPFTHNPSPYVNYSQIAGFWSGESANWNTVFTAWQSAQSPSDYKNLANLLQGTIINPANAFWGQAVQHGSKGSVTSIADGLLSNEGVTFTNGQINASSLASVSQTDQAMFFLDFYDQMMSYSGTGHVDWWMGSVNWSPALANAAVSNLLQQPMTIGMLDFTAEAGVKSPEGTVVEYGSNVFSNGHGAAVEGLIAGSTDGTGIMGVMPSGSAKVVVYDPYDATDTTNWTDIGEGYATLIASKIDLFNGVVSGAHVINASLGVPGWTFNPGWNTVFANNPTLATGAAHNTILVAAAGNGGVSQSTNVPWNFAINPQLLIVGSVGLNGTISNFSNTPGTACLSDTAGPSGACTQTLASRFLVAPGELILISDNNGNISRQTGTSLAAPLVTGAIGLLQTRWPWLVNYPAETADIILDSATKLGTNPGNDPIYGAGELNIQASQSPLNWNNLVYYPVTYGLQSLSPVKASTVINMVNGGNQSTWNAEGLYFTAIETIGNTFRDFEIPMSSKLVGQSTLTLGGVQQFQSYLNSSLQSWIKGGAHLDDNDDVVTSELAGFMETSEPAGNIMGMDVRAKMTPSAATPGFLQGSSPYNMEMAFVGGGTAVHFGFGSGAAALDSQNGFGLASDYNVNQGGANPLLGLASGGMFFDYRTALSTNLALNFGITQRRDMRDPAEFGLSNATESALLYQARAEQVGLDYAVAQGLLLHTSLTELHEDTGLLGTQSTDGFDLGRGSDTTGLTMGFDLTLPDNMLLTASSTMARTTTPDGQALRVTSGGLWSSAEEIALTKANVFAEEDRMRISLAKSMQPDAGGIVYSTYGVVNRQTGQLGVINETVDPSSSRMPLSAEALYGRGLWNRSADVSFYVRAETNSAEVATGNSFDYVLGGKFSLEF